MAKEDELVLSEIDAVRKKNLK